MLSGKANPVAKVPQGRSSDLLAAQNGVSPRYLQLAKSIKRANIEGLEGAVLSGAIPIKDVGASPVEFPIAIDPELRLAHGLPAMRALEKGSKEARVEIGKEIAGDARNGYFLPHRGRH